MSGSKKPAIDGQLIILAAGDESLFNDSLPAFGKMGKRSLYLGATGAGARMKLVGPVAALLGRWAVGQRRRVARAQRGVRRERRKLQPAPAQRCPIRRASPHTRSWCTVPQVVNMIMGSMMTAFCEGISLADKSGLKQSDLLEVLGLGALANPMFALKGPAIQARTYPPAFPLKHQQKDMRLALALGDQLAQPLPVAAAANEAFKAARALGRGDEDFAAVFEAVFKP